MTTTRTATYTWDPDDRVWLVEFPDEPGCHTFGRTLAAARENAADALALWLDLPADGVRVEERLELGELATLAARAREARDEAAHARQTSSVATEAAVIGLVTDAGLTYRDAAAVLDLSHQRVAQIVRTGTRRDPGRPRKAS